ncbi:hypothetical protein ES703_08862 [subsurface metagenome]
MEENKTGIQDLQSQALTLPEKAKQIHIIDDETLHTANEFIHVCRQMEKKIDDKMDPLIKKANELHRDTLATKREMKDPVAKAREIVSPQIMSYKRKIEEEIRAREEEKARKIEEERKKKEEAFEKAAALEKAGDQEKAEEEFEKAEKIEEEESLLALEPKFKPTAPETKGTSIRENWKFRVKNLKDVPREWLKLDEVKVGAAVRTSKGKIEIPGIETYSVDSLSLRQG